ncbi:MAG: ABC transporter ATP-binding protein [Methylotetracoccus sp.]|nr:ABC transporter ATP-binding protein [Methylotetracoccus sp.]
MSEKSHLIITDNIPPSASDRPAAPLIAVSGLNHWVHTSEGRLDILTAVNLGINSGETVAVVGASGSGKSTLLGLLAGLDVASEGEVAVDGIALGALDEDGRAEIRRRLIGFVFQSFQLIPTLTALENTMLPLELAGRASARAEAATMLSRVGLQHRLNHYPRQLSGGEQQRVALARAFATEPKILFADEPTGNLDRKTGHSIIELLFELNSEKNTTLVLVTHDEALATRCQRVIRLDSGRIVND